GRKRHKECCSAAAGAVPSWAYISHGHQTLGAAAAAGEAVDTHQQLGASAAGAPLHSHREGGGRFRRCRIGRKSTGAAAAAAGRDTAALLQVLHSMKGFRQASRTALPLR
ncbi:unnamed protein product, partial [Ectocarpus sp. 12 AP-2014]